MTPLEVMPIAWLFGALSGFVVGSCKERTAAYIGLFTIFVFFATMLISALNR